MNLNKNFGVKMLCGITLGAVLASTVACAGYGRGGSSGFSGRGGSSYSSRSYSSPSYRSDPVVNRTVYRTIHVTAPAATSAVSGGGIHPLTAGIAGYLVGDAINKHSQGQQQAPQQVIYSNPIPQVPPQTQTPPQSHQEVPGQQFQSPVQYVNADQPKKDSGLGLIEALVSIVIFALVVFIGAKYLQRKI